MESLAPILQGTSTPYNMPVYPGAQRIIAKALSHRHCTCMKIAVMDLSRSEYEMPTSNRS